MKKLGGDILKREDNLKLAYENSHKEIDGILYKRCAKHNYYFRSEDEWIPCDLDHFYKHKAVDGLFPYCKKCCVENSKENQIIRGQEWLDYLKRVKKVVYANSDVYRETIKRRSNKQRENGYQSDWRGKNPEKLKIYTAKHEDHKISKSEWIACKEYFNNQCAYCGLPIEDHYFTRKGITKNGDFHKEHVIHGGSNTLDNCVPSCKSCNSSKHTEDMKIWLKRQLFFKQERLDKIYEWMNLQESKVI